VKRSIAPFREDEFEPRKDRYPRLSLTLEASTIDHFTFERREEAFGHGIVASISG
jgi:hypothetical protein